MCVNHWRRSRKCGVSGESNSKGIGKGIGKRGLNGKLRSLQGLEAKPEGLKTEKGIKVGERNS